MFIIMDKKLSRKLYRNIRKSFSESEKTLFDCRITTALINSDFYKNSNLILVYVSVSDEIDTLSFISYSLKNNKRIAVPYCINENMYFCEIQSLDDLCEGKYGIPTVKPGNNIPVNITSDSLCIVPALCFDFSGNRIGYGGGYYDRFLSNNQIKTIGLCYERCICNFINSSNFDIPVDCILTENCFRNSKSKEVSACE